MRNSFVQFTIFIIITLMVIIRKHLQLHIMAMIMVIDVTLALNDNEFYGQMETIQREE